MSNTINGRTPEEITYNCMMYRLKRPNEWDEHCAGSLTLKGRVETAKWAYNYIQQLEDEIRLLRAYNKGTLQKIVQLERERDAAVEDMTELMKMAQSCLYCKRLPENGDCTFDLVAHTWRPWCWQWRGVQEVDN